MVKVDPKAAAARRKDGQHVDQAAARRARQAAEQGKRWRDAHAVDFFGQNRLLA